MIENENECGQNMKSRILDGFFDVLPVERVGSKPDRVLTTVDVQ